ncbi:hypothetical protein M378DRAFT_158737 [Amanita muscaria Koide BX008]|uniref:Pentatricopeptide repeat-containing protein n=1 Tax=Amanita muscaria (strain Koide BX008) TaxID=946122 RepID=A0A0C2XFI4_AMAMK|nr:hypothetical protein M378DRAFT_158737 [Amanita muscaria Koide BX008]
MTACHIDAESVLIGLQYPICRHLYPSTRTCGVFEFTTLKNKMYFQGICAFQQRCSKYGGPAPRRARCHRTIRYSQRKTAQRTSRKTCAHAVRNPETQSQQWRHFGHSSFRGGTVWPCSRCSARPNTSASRRESYSLISCWTASIPLCGDLDVKNIRNELLRVLETTNSATTAWNVYTKLSHIIPDGHCSPNKPFIPFVHLHRVSRLLSRNRPQTHIQFLRIFSVLDVLRSSGGRIHAYEWNTLIDHTARGWRKARVEDWELALSLYNDMVLGRPPGATFEGDVQASKGDENHIVKPDIYTYCSLLNVAVSTRQSQAVRRAIALLNASKIPPNRITFLTLLKHYSTTRHMSGVRSTVLKMREQGFELGLDGINACLWTYGWNGRLDIVTTIYRLLRHNASPEQEGTKDVILTLRRQLEEEEYICISDDIRPDGTTFATVIQLMAHYGDLLTTLSVFVDMLYILPSQPATSNGPNLRMTPPLNTIFRAIFLGFSQNGIPPCQDKNQLPSHIRISNPPDRPHWTLKNLQAMFDAFLSLPAEIRAGRSTVYWIMNAFDVTSGQNEDVLREVWGKLEARLGAGFVVHWVAPTNRLAKWRKRLFPELSKGERGDDETEDDASIP